MGSRPRFGCTALTFIKAPPFTPCDRTIAFSQLPYLSTMETKSQQPKIHDDVPSALNSVIDALNFARDTTNVKSAKGAFGSASVLLTTIRVGFVQSMSTDSQLICVGLDDQ